MSSAPDTNTVKQAAAPMPLRRRRFRQFGLSSLLLAMIPLGALFLGIRNYLDNRPIEWVPYSAKSLERELDDGRVVLISFSAEWSMNALVNERYALDRSQVKRYVRTHRVVPMKADWTDGSDEIRDALRSIRVNSIPAIAVYSPASPDTPIVLTDLVTEQQVLDALKTAVIVKSRPAPKDKK
jgi:thiol:disulfide interchange protein